MRTFRLALAQVNTIVGDLEKNVSKILSYVDQARAVGADLVAFPELAIPGYPPEDLLFRPSFIEENVKAMKKVVAEARGIAIVVGFVIADGDIRNSASVGYDGKLVGVYHKMYLPNYGVFDENRYFKRGNKCLVFTISGVNVGVNICEDIWYASGPTAVQRNAGAEVIVNINGSPYSAGKGVHRDRMVATRAADNELYVAYLNMVGGQDELVFDGASLICDQDGEVVARGKQFEEDLVVADLDVQGVFRSRLHNPRSRHENPTIVREISEAKVISVSPYITKDRTTLPARDITQLGPAEEVYRALVLGTRDYVAKNGFSKVVIGLSGGVDSSLTACIAVDALGKENVLGVAMSSRFTSEASVVDAKLLAKNLGIDLWTVPIEPAHTAFQNMLEHHFKGTEPNIAEENIQARIRGNTLMAISNKFGWLVLTTGNKSELATGYATLYGDMAGGFAVIKDVPKTLVYNLANWRNREVKREVRGKEGMVIPESVLAKAPTAELRPDQKDEDSLPPYATLDPILEAYVEKDRSYQELVDMGYDFEVVKKIITMVDRNEYKRRQAPPGVKITPRAFGKDRRLPIVNHYRQF